MEEESEGFKPQRSSFESRNDRPGFRRRGFSRFGGRRDEMPSDRSEDRNGDRDGDSYSERDGDREGYRERRERMDREREEVKPPEIKRGKARRETVLARIVYRGR